MGRWLGQTLKLSCLHLIGRMCKYLHRVHVVCHVAEQGTLVPKATQLENR